MIIDMENVIKGLEHCVEKLDTVVNKAHGFNCITCPYFRKCDRSGYLIGLPLMRDAIALLKAQEPRVMTLEEVRGSLKQPIWKEVRSSHKDLYTGWVLAYDIQTGQGITGTRLGMAEPSGRVAWYRLEDYGTKWRCWDKRPTDEQREAITWN